jgi:hypothetical protein
VLVAERDHDLRRAVAHALRSHGFATSETVEPAVAWGIAPFMDIVVLGDCLDADDTVVTFAAELRALRELGMAGAVLVVELAAAAAAVAACVEQASAGALIPG